MTHIQNFKFPTSRILKSKKETNEVNNISNFTKFIQNTISVYNECKIYQTYYILFFIEIQHVVG